MGAQIYSVKNDTNPLWTLPQCPLPALIDFVLYFQGQIVETYCGNIIMKLQHVVFKVELQIRALVTERTDSIFWIVIQIFSTFTIIIIILFSHSLSLIIFLCILFWFIVFYFNEPKLREEVLLQLFGEWQDQGKALFLGTCIKFILVLDSLSNKSPKGLCWS